MKLEEPSKPRLIAFNLKQTDDGQLAAEGSPGRGESLHPNPSAAHLNNGLKLPVKGNVAIDDDLASTEAFNLIKTEKMGMPLSICENPICDTQFDQTGITRLQPRRFCCTACRQQTWRIRRTAALLVPLGKERAWEILSK